MSTVIEAAAAAANQKRADDAKRLESAWRDYVKILTRKRAKDSDALRLVALAEEIRVPVDHIALHATVLSESARLKIEADFEEAARLEAVRLEGVIDDRATAVATAQALYHEALAEKEAAERAQLGAQDAHSTLARIMRAFPALFSHGQDMSEPPPPGHVGGLTPAVDAARSTVGMIGCNR